MKTDGLGKIRPQEGRGREKKDQGWKQGGAPGEAGQLLFRFDVSGRRRLPETLWDTAKQEIQKLIPFFFFESIHQSKRTLKQTFLCPPTTVGQGLPSPHFPTVRPAKSYRTQGSTQSSGPYQAARFAVLA